MTGSGRDGRLDMKRRYWAGHISAWNEEGLSHLEYCRRQRISIKSFQHWKSKFSKSTEGIKLVRLPAEITPVEQAPHMVHEHMWRDMQKSLSPLILHTGEKYRLDIGKGFDEETFCRVVGLL